MESAILPVIHEPLCEVCARRRLLRHPIMRKDIVRNSVSIFRVLVLAACGVVRVIA